MSEHRDIDNFNKMFIDAAGDTSAEFPYNFLPAMIAADRMAEEKYRDDLTGLYNQDFLDNYINKIFDAKRDHGRVCVVFMDVNFLKKTNDTFGHEAGDKLISNAGQILLLNSRKGDFPCRRSGDEFIGLFFENKGDQDFKTEFPQKITDRLLNSVKQKEGLRSNDQEPVLSVAVGASIFDGNKHQNIKDTIAEAEKLMYAQKLAMHANRE